MHLTGDEKRLLRHLRRIDPGVTLAQPREYGAADRLEAEGLIEKVGPATSLARSYRITDKGRTAK